MDKMIKKILIANRGEIACRIMTTVQRMGLKAVAVYSDADRHALHVKMADEAFHIGPPAASQSYISIDKILQAVADSGVDAVHPGYGFLSENANFARQLQQAGIIFIGPNPHAIEVMGDKITSKKLAQEAGVPTVPGYMGLVENVEQAVKIAREISYPVIIKASAGGGGKGMRIAWDDAGVRNGFQSSKNEAESSFGDDRIFIEKFITHPRHIEIQVLGDRQGHVIHLGERECTIQRRNQKVIEEAPSSFLDEKSRDLMGAQAVALAKAVTYDSAGTVEFIVDADKNFYFLEMNTRLQVEHPVTELITGLDLVEQMIRIAGNEALPLAQEDVKFHGWAMESRIYAEDPYRNFLPSIGRLKYYRPPAIHAQKADKPTIRNDTGVYEGDEISIFYDPMISKLCVWAPTREIAISTMQEGLDGFILEGIGHNIPFLQAVYAHPRFVSGDISTSFLEDEYKEGFSGAPVHMERMRHIAACCAWMYYKTEVRNAEISGSLVGHKRHVSRDWVVQCEEEMFTVQIRNDVMPVIMELKHRELCLALEIIGQWAPGQNLAQFFIDNQALNFKIKPAAQGYEIYDRGCGYNMKVLTPRAAELLPVMPKKILPDLSRFLLCPMPGMVVTLLVKEGDEVQGGQALVVVEAMKMENTLRAEKKAVIGKIHIQPGESLAVDDIIMEFCVS